MIEFIAHGCGAVAINPKLVAAVIDYRAKNLTIVCFGNNDEADVYLADPYEVVLAKIREANAADE